MARAAYHVSEDSHIHRTVDSVGQRALSERFWRLRVRLGAALRAFAAGAIAPVLAAMTIGVTISLTASAIFLAAGDDVTGAQDRLNHRTSQIQSVAPVATLLFTIAVARWLTRRDEEAAVFRGGFVALGSSLFGVAIGLAFGGELSASALGYSFLSLLASEAGVAWSYERAAASQALLDASAAMREARTLDDVLRGARHAPRGGERARLTLFLRGSSGDDAKGFLASIADSAGSDGEHARIELERMPGLSALFAPGGPPTLDEADMSRAERASLSERGMPPGFWIRVHGPGDVRGALLVRAARRRWFRRRHAALWASMAGHVELAWRNLDLIERERASALERERGRMSDAIHDTLAQDLAGAILHLEAAARSHGAADDAVTGHLAQALRSTRESLARARRLVWANQDLRPEETLGEMLSKELAEWSREARIEAEVVEDGQPLRLPEDARALVLRAAREGLANVKKHAQAASVRLTLRYGAGAVSFELADDGLGLRRSSPSSPVRFDGYGLKSLTSSAERLGGAVTVTDREEGGTSLLLKVPTRAPAIADEAT
jgi:signal transduction histidine kinase